MATLEAMIAEKRKELNSRRGKRLLSGLSSATLGLAVIVTALYGSALLLLKKAPTAVEELSYRYPQFAEDIEKAATMPALVSYLMLGAAAFSTLDYLYLRKYYEKVNVNRNRLESELKVLKKRMPRHRSGYK